MSTEMSDEEIRSLAIQRVGRKKGFFIHLMVYCVVNLFLWSIWVLTSGGISAGFGWGIHFPWPVFPTLGWGIGLVFHGLGVFAFHGGWEKKEIDREIEQIKKGNG